MAKPPNLGTIIAVAKKLLGYFSRTPVRTLADDLPPTLTNQKIRDMFDELYSWTPTRQGLDPNPGPHPGIERYIDPFNDPPQW